MKKTEIIWISFFTATPAELRAAEAKQRRLESAGYRLVRTTSSTMVYKLEGK